MKKNSNGPPTSLTDAGSLSRSDDVVTERLDATLGVGCGPLDAEDDVASPHDTRPSRTTTVTASTALDMRRILP
jgi:hypothetical protein